MSSCFLKEKFYICWILRKNSPYDPSECISGRSSSSWFQKVILFFSDSKYFRTKKIGNQNPKKEKKKSAVFRQ